MKKTAVVILLLLTLVTPIFAEGTASNSDNMQIESDGRSSLGMYFMGGEFSMIGLSYHQWMGNHGIMISAGLDSRHTSALVEYQYSIFSALLTETMNTRLYVWCAGGVNFRTDSIIDHTNTLWNDETHINAVASLGVGVEFVWWKHISVPVQFGYVAEFPYDTEMSFCLASGVRYRF
ncbi:MAG: hypothetical protein J5747_09775 [Spirochaetaceae bacterium]|nr:hypothetical protein [Spirochaetaceae bacterium]